MPVTPTYPGVYIEEIPSGVRTITGGATSTTAFVGRARRGPVDEAYTINGYADFERVFGGLWVESTMSYAMRDFFLNGGSQAIIVRINNGATPATITVPDGLTLQAKTPGLWGEGLRLRVNHDTRDPADETLYNLTVRDTASGAEERYLNVSTDDASPRSLDKLLEASALVEVSGNTPDERPVAHQPVEFGDPFADTAPAGSYTQANNDGDDGQAPTDAQYRGSRANKKGIYALLDTDLFNLLCIPPPSRTQDVAVNTTLAEALALCVEQRAMLLVDPRQGWDSVQDVIDDIGDFGLSGNLARNAAIFFPRLRQPDPEQEGLVDNFAPSGAVAGVFARTDAQRGVWKAPAGIEASLTGVPQLSVPLTDAENGQLNPLGVNCLRALPDVGRVVWGARTLQGADRLASEWKYIPVRRLALYIEESLYRGTQWAVFEPNDEPLWGQIRLNVGAFMQNLFRQGAFQGRTPQEAYFVKSDSETTTQNDINLGILNIVVGFAPLKPAEFLIIKIQQMAGQIET